ncbi:hypothetical protein BG005_006370 [Podila minutissima]|nr:hypothetical protein BG005_006370 [Podila minutissima]
MSDTTSTTTTSTSSTSISETITSTLVSSITATISATLSATATPTPTSTPDWSEPPSDDNVNNTDPTKLLCEWTREAVHCKDSEFTTWMLVASSAAHFIVALYGIWLLQYRNRGFNSKIVTDLYTKVGTGLRPKPMDCIIFFTSLACFVKVAANLPLVFGKLENMMWLRVAIEQLYWVLVAIAFSSYFVGLLYAMPVTTREGIFAVYQPEVVYGTRPLPAIHVLTPTTVQKNVMLAIGAIYPTVFGAGLGIASGALHDHGMKEASRVLMLLQYSNWVLIMWSMAVMFFYYGLKYTFILRANIIIAEAALKAPRAAFGIGNLKSRSPARFLFIQLQILGFGGCAVTVLAGTLCMIWVLFKGQILALESDVLPHVMACLWTCAIALAFFVVFTLIAAQSIRNRRRGLHEPSTTLSHSYGPGDSSAQKSSGKAHRSGQDGISGFGPEARLTQHSSGELSTLRSIDSLEKNSLERLDRYGDPTPFDEAAERAAAAASVAAMTELSDRMDQEQNRDSWRPTSPATRAPAIQIGNNNNNSTPANHSNIRESVFGGRTAREEPGPTSPTGGGFSLPSFPLVSMRSGSRNSTQPRPSTSSATHTTSTTSSRLSHGSSKHGGNSAPNPQMPTSPTSPTSPTHANVQSLQMQTQQQLQQLAAQQQTQKMPGQRGAKGGFQAIPENQHVTLEDRGGDLLYSDSLQYRQQQQPQQRTKAPRPSMDADVQLQQQHPLHQVAFKGLSPPPRSTASSMLPMASPPTSPISSSPGGRNKGASPTPSPMMGPVMSSSVLLSSPPSPAMRSQHRARTANEAMQAQQAAFPAGYEDSYQVPRVGGAVRRSSNQSKAQQSLVSSPVMVPASRGPGGGYQSQVQPPPQPSLRQKSYLNAQPPPPPQPQYEPVGYYGQREEFDDGASVESAEDWPLPPNFK